MSEETQIIFLYSQDDVPGEILDEMDRQRPDNFALRFVEQNSNAAHRLEAIASADYIIGYPGDPSPRELDCAPNLKLLQLLSAGYEHVDLDEFRKRSIPVANNGGANAPTVAEHAIMLMLALYKKLPLHHNALVNGIWLGSEETLNMRELRGKTLGIVGFGRIGQEVARVARGFQTTTLYHDAVRACVSLEAELAAEPRSLEALLSESDVVTLHTSLNAASAKLINAETLSLMKSTAILINTSRGPVVDEQALGQALREGRIAGAGLDVFETEPTAADNVLLSLPNVVCTSHIAGITLDTWYRRIDFGYHNVQRVAAGKQPDSVVS